MPSRAWLTWDGGRGRRGTRGRRRRSRHGGRAGIEAVEHGHRDLSGHATAAVVTEAHVGAAAGAGMEAARASKSSGSSPKGHGCAGGIESLGKASAKETRRRARNRKLIRCGFASQHSRLDGYKRQNKRIKKKREKIKGGKKEKHKGYYRHFTSSSIRRNYFAKRFSKIAPAPSEKSLLHIS